VPLAGSAATSSKWVDSARYACCDSRGQASPGHPTDRRHDVPRKITVQSGAKRHPKDADAAGRSALDGDLGRLKTAAPGGWPFPSVRGRRALGRPAGDRQCPGVALGRQPAVRRRVLRRSCQPGCGGNPAGALRPPPPSATPAVAFPARARASSREIDALSGARRARRAFKWVCKESPHRGERWQRVLRRVMCDTHPPTDVRQRHTETTADSSSACFAERLGTYPHRAATGRSGFPGADDRGSNAEIINSVTSRRASNRPWGPWSALLR
jgi:hypothetical protein